MVLLETFINPISEFPLSISTGIQTKDMIVHDLLKASEIVKDQMKNLLASALLLIPQSRFLVPQKSKLNTFKNMNKVTACNHYGHSYSWFIFKNSILFRRIVQQIWNLISITPGSIINVFDWSRWNSKKTSVKSGLPHKLEKHVELRTEYLRDSVYEADEMATVREVKPLKSTCSEFAVRLLNVLCQTEVNQKELMSSMKTIEERM